MARWSDLAVWRGPTVNQSGPMQEHRGLVIHIAAGYYEGTISWQKNADANVSSHFVLAGPRDAKWGIPDGKLAQVVDTDVTAWTQILGNGHWLSVECSGFVGDRLSAAQVESVAQLLARGHREYGIPLQLATSPAGRGLGHHSMGAESGINWGHSACPGEPIKAQKAQILARAIEIVGGDMELTAEQAHALESFARYGDPRIEAQTLGLDVIRFGPDKGKPVFPVQSLRRVEATLAAVLAAVRGDDDAAAILAGVDERLTAQRRLLIAELVPAIVGALPDGPVDRDDLIAALTRVLGSVDGASPTEG